MARGCTRFHDDLSPFVDETLPEKRWEDVARHLAGCAPCRDEVVEIRELRSALMSSQSHVEAPTTLASRLEAIAGDDCSQPLYLRGGEPCALPSKRRRRQRLALQGAAAVLVAAVGVAMIAILLSPTPRVIDEPIGEAREQFALQTTALSVQEAVGAVLLAQDRGARLAEVSHVPSLSVPEHRALPISRSAADQTLGRARSVDVPVSGVQNVFVTNANGAWLTSDVGIDRVAGEGASLVVYDRRGDTFLSSFMPDFSLRDVHVPADWDFRTYPTVVSVAGRDATILEARDDDRAVARWWLDVASGIVLRSERYDSNGAPTIIVGYEHVRVGDARLPASRTSTVSLSRATASGTRGWCVGFSECPYELAGMPLVAYSSSTAGGEHAMSLVYSNGVQTLTASWTEGRLADGLQASAGAAAGLPLVSAWQAGPGVVSVTTNGSREMLQEAARGLPERREHEVDLWQRLGAGLGRITGLR